MIPALFLIAAISLPDKPTRNEEFAAGEFQYWHEQLTGKKRPVYDVCIGRAFGEKHFPADIKDLEGSEGFAVRVKDGKLYLFGAKPCGNCFAVYDFFEKNTDIIWPSMAEGVDRVFTKVGEVPLRVVNYREKPTFKHRCVSINNGVCYNHPRTEAFSLRLKANSCVGTAARRKTFGFPEDDFNCHNIYKFLPWEKYKDTHPEYFALIDGERKKPGFDSQVCYSAPGGAEEVARNFVHDRYECGQPCETAGLAVEDHYLICRCPGCMAPITLPDGRVLKREENKEEFDSTRYWLWMNRVAREIKKIKPEFRPNSLAYMNCTMPPPIQIEDNIIVGYVPSSSSLKQDYLGDTNAKAWKWMCEWNDRCREWTNWEWWGCAAQYPRPVHVVIRKNLELLSKMKLFRFKTEWIHKEGAEYTSGIEYWIFTKLLWNVDQDVNALRDEYLNKTFRAAAPEMKKFYDIVRDTWYADSAPSFSYDNPSRLTGYHLLSDPKTESAAFAALSNAVVTADHPVSKLMAEKILETMTGFAEKARKSMARTTSAVCPKLTTGGLNCMSGSDWGRAAAFEFKDFRNLWGEKKGLKTPISAHLAHDGETLYFKLRAGIDPRKEKKAERLFGNDHWEVFIQANRSNVSIPYCQIAFDWMDRRWTSAAYEEKPGLIKWNVEYDFKDNAWEALVTVPMEQLEIRGEPRIYLYHWDGANKEHAALRGTGTLHDPAGFLKLERGK
ncbi:MAG: DUF4838 domain-containing protein [Kiritimatiellia bacterium]|nr:DUF4838 domain-containing protein [Kiritimatiellia bacterium]